MSLLRRDALRVSLAIAAGLLMVFVGFRPVAAKAPVRDSALGNLEIWNDGLSEMCYYDARMTIYGKPRAYTRVHLTNRQWNSRETGVKTGPEAEDAVPVFKFNMAEEVPTENYQYRFLTTIFVNRDTLAPLKMVSSSMEWCGATFKHLRWDDDALNYRTFSYFPGEGDTQRSVDAEAVPFEASFILVREFVASDESGMTVKMLPPLRSNKDVAPRVSHAIFRLAGHESLRVPAGEFEVVRVELAAIEGGGALSRFWVEKAAPHKIVKFQSGDERGELRFVERRAYWDRGWESGFYKAGDAP